MAPHRSSACLALATAVTLLASLAAPACAVRIYVFGDSFLDVGNTLYDSAFAKRKGAFIPNMAPYGRALTPPKPTGRFSDGKVFVDYLAEAVGQPWVPPYLLFNASRENGTNFAFSGAGALNETTLSFIPYNLLRQMQWFNNATTGLTAAQLADAVAVIYLGQSDYANWLQNNPFKMKNAFNVIGAKIINSISSAVKTLAAKGVKKVVIANIGPVGCAPKLINMVPWSGGKCLADVNKVATDTNAALAVEVGKLRTSLPTTTIVLFDIYSAFQTRAAAANIALNKGACCGQGKANGGGQCGVKNKFTACAATAASSFLFWDGLHPTQATSGDLFQAAWSGGSSVITPMNLQMLLVPAASRRTKRKAALSRRAGWKKVAGTRKVGRKVHF